MKTRFQRMALTTTVATYLLIVVGALVRASGAGMGCPDWPRCFDRWVPPTDLSQVPAALAPYFNLRLAWTEYLNRLLGVLTGFLVFGTLVLAVVDHRKHRRVLGSSIGAFVGVGLAGWLGKRVVEKNLDPSFVTIHMFVALSVVGLLLDATLASYPAPLVEDHASSMRARSMAAATTGVLSLLLVQIGLGTRVRAGLERVAHRRPDLARGEWITQLGSIDHAHRGVAVAVLVVGVALAVWVVRQCTVRAWRRLAVAGGVGAVLQVLVGIGLAYAPLPAPLQVLHIAIASLLMGTWVTLALITWRAGGLEPIDGLDEPAHSHAGQG